jgi:hypothetical protein
MGIGLKVCKGKKGKINRKLIHFTIFLVLISFSSVLFGENTLYTATAQDSRIYSNSINVGIVVNNTQRDYMVAFRLDSRLNITIFNAGNISEYENHVNYLNVTFILDFNLLNQDQIKSIINNVSYGMGLFFQANNRTEIYNDSNLRLLETILPVTHNLNPNLTGLEVPKGFGNINTRVNESLSHPLLTKIGFLSLPQLLYLSDTQAHGNASVLVSASSGEPIFSESTFDSGLIFTLNSPLKEDTNENLGDWPYFTYFIFATSMHLSGVENIESYGNWAFSPLPTPEMKQIVIIILIAISFITVIGFFYMKQRSKKTPLFIKPLSEIEIHAVEQAKRDYQIRMNEGSNAEKTNKMVTNDKKLNRQEKRKQKKQETDIGFAEVGFHRPLAGFNIMFYLSFCLLLPLIVVVMYILPTFILTDPAQMGITFLTGNIFNAVFMAGDFGLAQAFDKFVGEHYIKDPGHSLKYVQFFIWFQMLTGLIQTTGISLIGMYIIPQTTVMAFMSYQFMVVAFVQWPGIGYLWTHSLKALQRTDKEQVVNLISLIFFDIAGVTIFSALFLGPFSQNPMIGSVIGGSLALTLSNVFKTFGLLLVSGIVFGKLDKRFTMKDMFRIDFDRTIVKETLWFGFKSMLSNVIFLMGNFIATIIIMMNLDNYTYWGTFIGSTTFLLYPITFMLILYENSLPAVAEAYGNNCKKLTEAYISYGWKYFGVYGTIVLASFFFFISRFLTEITPPLYKPMGMFIGLYSITKLIMVLGDFSRFFLIAINKVGIYILFVSLEQISRIIVLISLINVIQEPQYLLIFGELPGVFLKIIFTWWYTNQKIIHVKINLWQTVFAPLCATLVYISVGYLVLSGYDIWLQSSEPLIPTIICSFIIFTGLTISVYPFALGIFGGWDTETIRQMRFAAENSGPSKIFAKIFLLMSEKGNQLSKLYNKHPIEFQEASIEIEQLMNIKLGKLSK